MDHHQVQRCGLHPLFSRVVLQLQLYDCACADDQPPICDLADAVIAGEAEIQFPRTCQDLLAGRAVEPRFVPAAPPDLGAIALPYGLYSDEDVGRRTIYVEASRGCPHGCEFCLAALDHKVRRFPEDAVLFALHELWARGVRRFKFVDRLKLLIKHRGEGTIPWEEATERLPDESLSDGEGHHDLHEALAALPEREREAVRAVYLEGQTYDEAAERTGIPLGSLKRALRTGLASLREKLSDEDEPP